MHEQGWIQHALFIRAVGSFCARLVISGWSQWILPASQALSRTGGLDATFPEATWELKANYSRSSPQTLITHTQGRRKIPTQQWRGFHWGITVLITHWGSVICSTFKVWWLRCLHVCVWKTVWKMSCIYNSCKFAGAGSDTEPGGDKEETTLWLVRTETGSPIALAYSGEASSLKAIKLLSYHKQLQYLVFRPDINELFSYFFFRSTFSSLYSMSVHFL